MIGRILEARAAEGKETEVYLHGTILSREKIRKETMRHRHRKPTSEAPQGMSSNSSFEAGLLFFARRGSTSSRLHQDQDSNIGQCIPRTKSETLFSSYPRSISRNSSGERPNFAWHSATRNSSAPIFSTKPWNIQHERLHSRTGPGFERALSTIISRRPCQYVQILLRTAYRPFNAFKPIRFRA